MKAPALKTPEQVKAEFRSAGITVSRWALEQRVNPATVYQVLSGANQGRYGEGHRVAVMLGIKSAPASGRAAR